MLIWFCEIHALKCGRIGRKVVMLNGMFFFVGKAIRRNAGFELPINIVKQWSGPDNICVIGRSHAVCGSPSIHKNLRQDDAFSHLKKSH